MALLPKCNRQSRLELLILFISLNHRVLAAKPKYCSEINTSSENSSRLSHNCVPNIVLDSLHFIDSSVFQSNGLCSDLCIENYAFAILQDQNCWCSNYIPATTTNGCDLDCPGYPFEKCGGTNVYGYIPMGKVLPSGTLGASTSLHTPTQSSSAPISQVTVTADPIIVTRTESASVTSTMSLLSSSSTSSSTIATSTPINIEPTTLSTWTPTPVTSVRTVSGSGVTVTVTPTEPPAPPTSSSPTHKPNESGMSTGAAVGLTAGLVALVAILCSVIYLCLRKRREQNSQDGMSIGDRRGSSAGLGGQIPSRTMSENSRYVLGTDGRRVVETWEFKDELSPKSGKLIPVDPRLDPFAPVYRLGDNKSRDSVNTLRDDLDYSRRVHGGQRGPILRATNPDEDD